MMQLKPIMNLEHMFSNSQKILKKIVYAKKQFGVVRMKQFTMMESK